MTTVTLTRQDLMNKVSLTGKVTMNPIFGIVAPVDGEVRYLDVTPPRRTPTKPTKVAGVWVRGKATIVEIPAGATLAGRLVDDKAAVTAGMPIVAAKHAGYGIVAEIDSAQAYQLSDTLGEVMVQIKNGPGPFPCTVLGTIAALPAGTVPEPPAPPPADQQNPQNPDQPPVPAPNAPNAPGTPGGPGGTPGSQDGSDATGMRLVCIPPADVKLINGAAATIEVITQRATQTMVAPVEAVAGRQGNGKVDVIGPDGGRQTKDVVLGLTDGRVIEIKSGLTGTETLAVPGPNLPEAPPGPDGPNGPVGK
ncbi:MAG TPA: efflux RND transporter periplasmic adaptor subunit [Actinophytocola sp.]|uniref:efflux RND transporter periplasmic adaptor subunit n=1 Tax=Actinophytocola sp. TaxID=1872138 RepID=UPI002DDD56EA|nr:efflux RND transporter periplasmic adaptor subunit [Actinophytocola sp.]HEV2783980.1 efflux RND transporter periplasmic adaptor subunit [Actinophytocola sp.]